MESFKENSLQNIPDKIDNDRCEYKLKNMFHHN